MAKISKKSIGKIVSVVLIAITAVLLFVVLLSKFSGEPVFIFNRSMLWVLTESMEPEIPARSYILVEKVDAKDVQVGDVISFYSDDPTIQGSLNTHRVVKINDDGSFVTKGDNNIIEDNYSVSPDKVLGRYINVLPFMSAVGRFLLWGPGILIVVAVLALLIAVIYIPEIVKTARQVKLQQRMSKDDEIRRRVDEEIQKLKDSENNK